MSHPPGAGERIRSKLWDLRGIVYYLNGDMIDVVDAEGVVDCWPIEDARADASLSPEWVEWLMGWPVGWTSLEPLEEAEIMDWQSEHDIPRLKVKVKGDCHRQRLQALGNGWVPQCGAVAWRLLTGG